MAFSALPRNERRKAGCTDVTGFADDIKNKLIKEKKSMKLKSKKSALLLSFTSLLLCFAMLAGSTFAWFTDTATTGVNKIVAGNLKVDIVDATNTDKSLTGDNGKLLWTQKVVSEGGGALEAVTTEGLPLWEPGVTFLTQGFKIKNGGNLALKWKMAINKENVENGKVGSEVAPSKSLLDVIDFSVVKSTDENATAVAIENFVGELKKQNAVSADTYYIKAHMQETAGNDYQNLTLDGITITVYATQLNSENDSFGPNYDKDAPLPLVATRNELNTTITRDSLKKDGKIAPVEVTLGNLEAEDIQYTENSSGYTGKGVMLGSTNLNKYAATPAAAGEYKFTFKDGTITSTATGYGSIDNYKNTSVYMLVPGNSDVVFENMTFNGVVSFDIQKYTSPWSNLNSISFKNCTFNGIIIGTCPASNVTFDGCTFKNYTNATKANSSNPIWWREDTEGTGANANPIKTFTFVNNKVIGTRPVKIERIGKTVSPIFTIKNNEFDISRQNTDTAEVKNMAINIGMGENPNLPFTLIDEGNTISSNTAALYTVFFGNGSNQYKEISGMKVLDGNGNNKVITALVWKTTTGETFEMKTID